MPLVADVRDELAEDVRLDHRAEIARGRSRLLLMESLFKLTELESRIPLNMNVLVKGRVPTVVGLAEALREWLDHRRDVLVRRSKHRLAAIDHRLEVLGGSLVAYLNLDKVIKIIRTEDEPKPVLMKTFKLTDVQADAILNMRLRNLRKLEEMEIRSEDKELRDERKKLKALLGSEAEQWKTIAAEIKEMRDTFGPKTPLGKRRTTFGEAPEHDAGRDRGGVGRARADDGRRVGEGLGPRAARPCHRSVRRRVQDRRRVEIRVPGRDHVAMSVLRHQRQFLHHRCREAARAGAAMASRYGCSSIIEQDADIVAAFRHQGGRKFLVAQASRAAASWCRRTSAWPIPARASRC